MATDAGYPGTPQARKLGIRAALPLGIVDVKVAAIDHDWSGQRYVWRRENRDAVRSRPRLSCTRRAAR